MRIRIAPPISSRSDGRHDPSDEPRGDRPACAREETHTEPDADLVEVDGGGHIRFSPTDEGNLRGGCELALLQAEVLDILPVRSRPTHDKQHHEDDQNDADDTNTAVTVAVAVPAEAATEATKQEDDE
jgi:hypothetical protein